MWFNQQLSIFCVSAVVVLAATPAWADVTTVTGVRLKSTEKGLQVILETASGEVPQILPISFGKTYVANIINTQLRLPNKQEFRALNPAAGITSVTVTPSGANSIRVTITGTSTLPTAKVVESNSGLVLLIPSPTTTQAPPTTTQAPETPTDQSEEEIPATTTPEDAEVAEETPEGEELEIVVTGERETGYSVPNATTGTRTDTPLRDIPQSIQVVPQEVIRDQQVTRLDEALRNVSGVIFRGDVQSRGEEYTIRGFDNVPILRDGFRRYGFSENFPEVANLERVEVLKGPASILYGEIQPGGLINLVSKKPLAEPFYEAELQVGNWGFVRPRIDISELLTSDGRLRYRLNALYRRGDSFRGFDQEDKRFFIAPVLSWKISDRTDLSISLEYTNDERPADIGLPVVGDQVADVPRDRIINEPDDKIQSEYLNVGYDLEHRFSDNWKIRNAFRYSNYNYDYGVIAYDLGGGFDEETGILNRSTATQDGQDKNYALQTNLIGEFTTGSIAHTLLFGVDFSHNDERIVSRVGDTIPLNVFNPVYRQFTKPDEDEIPSFGGDDAEVDRLGIYLQDQISIFDNLKLLAGLRYDTVDQDTVNIPGFAIESGEVNRNYDALTPRVGIVYQPIEEVSLYASYSQSFNPNTANTATGDPLEPEKGEGYEVGIKAQLLDNLFATLAYFDITKQNVAVTDPNFAFASIATGEQQSRGVELDVTGEILPGWNIIAAYAYIDAEVTEDLNPDNIGNRLFNVPKHSASLWTTYQIQSGNLQGLGFGVGFNFVGEREGNLDNSFQADSYFLTNAAIFYRRNNWRFALNLKNLFDINYIDSVENVRSSNNLPGDPFTVIGSVSVEF